MEKQIRITKTFRTDIVIEDPNEPELKAMEYISSILKYDEFGNVVYEANFDPQGHEVEKIESKFAADSKLLERVMYDEEGELAERTTYEYNESGLLKFHYLHYLDGSMDTVTYAYDDQNNLVSRVTADDEGNTELKEVYEYKDGKRIRELGYNSGDEMISEKTFEYNKDGKLTGSSSWNEEEGMKFSIENEYDEAGKLSNTLTYNENAELIAREYFKLDNEGRVIEVTEESSKGTNTLYLVYDEVGNAINQEEYNQDNELNHKVVRKYNEFNRLIESDVYIDRHGKGMSQHYVIRMEYQYYE